MIERFLAVGELRPGVTLSFLDAEPERQYFNNYRVGDPLAMLAQDREQNDPLIINLFRTVADYYIEDVLSGLELDGISDRQMSQIRQSIYFALLYGACPVMRIRDIGLAVSPRGFWPLLDRGENIGSVIVVPYSTTSMSGAITSGPAMPDRALALEIIRGREGTLYDAPYSGVTMGSVDWRRFATIAAVGVVDGGIPMFPSIRPIVEACDAMMQASVKIVRRHAAPHIQVPPSCILYDEQGNPSLPINTEEGTIFPVNFQDKDVQYVSLEADARLMQFTFTALLTQLSALTGVPLAAFNIATMPRLESASGLSRFQSTAQDRSRHILHSVISAYAEIGISLRKVEVNEPAATNSDIAATT